MTASAFRNSVSRRDKWLARFGTAVRYARVEAGWSQAELAEHLHVSRSNIANIEAGRQDIPSWKAAQLVALLHMDLPGWTLEPDELGDRLKAAEAGVPPAAPGTANCPRGIGRRGSGGDDVTAQAGQLWPLEIVAGHLGLTIGSTRHWLSGNRITAARRAPGNLALYDAARVRDARAEQLRKAARRADMRHWLRRA